MALMMKLPGQKAMGTDKKQLNKKPRPAGSPKRQKFFLGVFFLGAAFIGVVTIFYLVINDLRLQSARLDAVKEQLAAADAEKSVIEQKSAELAQVAGKSIRVDHLVTESRKINQGTIKESKEGYLWVDRSAGVWIVTVGVLNGAGPGSRFTVYQGQEAVDTVVVQTPLDVISYVQPTEKLKNQFDNDYFRVVLEK
jgi:hypothetical protein